MTRPIRVAFGITDLDVGGAEKTLVELACRLDPAQWTASVVCLQRPGPLAQSLVRHGIPVESMDVRGLRDAPSALMRWRRILRRCRPDILQTFLFHANLLGRLAGGLAGVPHVLSGIRVAERRSRWRLRLDRWTHWLVQKHVCVSQAVQQFMHEQAGIPLDRLTVIPNGVSTSAADGARPIARAQIDASAEQTVLLYLGRLDPQKGLEDLFVALELLADREVRLRPAGILRVALVGEGPLRRALETSVAEHSLGTIVRFAGWQPNPHDWLAAADGLVLPSHWEGMPNVVLEAMAARLPVIATAVEGATELVRPGQTGWLVPPNQPGELADALWQFLHEPERRREFGRAGRALVEQRHTYEHMVPQYEELYRSMLSQPRQG